MLHRGAESTGHPGPVQQQVAAASKGRRAERGGGSALDGDTHGCNPGLRLPEGFPAAIWAPGSSRAGSPSMAPGSPCSTPRNQHQGRHTAGLPSLESWGGPSEEG